MRRHDGEYRWFLVRHDVLRDDEGKPLRLYASATDIHDRKQAEERVREENRALREEVDKTSMFEEIVGSSAPLRSVLAHVEKVAPTDSTVLITGETGTGKELVARAIHKRSSRSARPFISVNCAAMPASLIASELFGHEKGAFTGASQRRQGRFELADGGTIFLDEVGELPAETQMALLRVLQEREFERVGGSRPDSRRCPRHCRDQPGSATGRRGQNLPRRSVLPLARVSARDAALARPGRGRSPPGRVLHPPLRAPDGKAGARRQHRRPWIACSATTGQATFESCRTSSSGR